MALVQFNLKLQPEVVEQFKEAQGNSEALTGNAFVEMLLEAYLNPKTKEVKIPVPTEQQAAEIQNLQNEIGLLKTNLSLKEDRIKELETRNGELETLNAEPAPPAGVTLAENQEIITFDKPLVLRVLDIERELAGKQAKKEISRSQHLIDTFFMGITNGNSYPYRVWSSGELQKINKQLQTTAQ